MLSIRNTLNFEHLDKVTPQVDADFASSFIRSFVYNTKRSEKAIKIGPFQTSFFSCAEPNVNEQNHLFQLICIRLATFETGHTHIKLKR